MTTAKLLGLTLLRVSVRSVGSTTLAQPARDGGRAFTVT